ncbi:MAG: nickel-dependent hydrogenase large subunit [Roseiflexaceae bacterium]
MCFKNLPIEFDAHGRPSLRPDASGDPFAVPRPPLDPAAAAQKIAAGAHIKEVMIDPVTRVAGALAFHAVVDLQARRVLEAHTEARIFRGYEVILKGRAPTDAIDISSRACGVCGGVHATCAAMALEMACGVVPPPLAVIARNLGEAAELLYDHSLHLFLLAGPDYSEAMVRPTNPSLWNRAQQTLAPHSTVHGLRTIAEIMEGLNPLRGPLYMEALDITRVAREIASLMLGKYPHPSAIIPGGLTTTISTATFNQVLGRIVRLLDYSKKVALLWEDIVEFFYAEIPDYRAVGQRPKHLIGTGMWDDPEAYDASFANCDAWGERRQATPGVIVDGQLRTTRLTAINLGMEEFVDHSFYEQWHTHPFPTDPLGGPLSPYHPWNKQTIPNAAQKNWKDRYTWATAPRWDRLTMESGPISRHWITAAAGKLQNPFIAPHSNGLQIELPKGPTPALTLVWKIPDTLNALERMRARAYHVAYCCMVAYTYLLQGFAYLRQGKSRMTEPYQIPAEGIGVGFWEAGRGILTHHTVVEGGRLGNYQILTPSSWMASPRDPWGQPGPYEEAVLNTPILEEFSRPEDFKGIDILRTIRSFDPCMPCTVHMLADGQLIVRDATTCACGVD